ncbi:glucoamylase family protein [Nostocoides australiense]|nr:glucoamylase family protein [Tetrasphaera australiensis]
MPVASMRKRWAGDTWRSLAALVHDESGLPADQIGADLAPATRLAHTSPTNIGGYLWSVAAAYGLGLIDEREGIERCRRALHTLDRLERHEPTGMFFNWYAFDTGALITSWPGTGARVIPFLSSVDNAWLAVGLRVISSAFPKVADEAHPLLAAQDFGAFYDPDARPGSTAGEISGGFWLTRPRRPHRAGTYCAGSEVIFPPRHHYDLLYSETRIASYVGVVAGQLPRAHFDILDAGTRTYRGRTVVATCGGAMFEALMPDLFVPEGHWAPDTFGRNHSDTVACHREFGLEDKRYGYWGFSSCAHPGGGYSEFGVRPIAWLPRGYPSTKGGEGIVTPHAAALALPYAAQPAEENLSRIESELGCYGPGGFVDSVGVVSRRTADGYLAVDQACVLAALANLDADGCLQRWFVTPDVEASLRPLVAGRPWPIASRVDEA